MPNIAKSITSEGRLKNVILFPQDPSIAISTLRLHRGPNTKQNGYKVLINMYLWVI